MSIGFERRGLALSELKALPKIEPSWSKGETTGIHHAKLVKLVEAEIKDHDQTIDERHYAVAAGGRDFVGLWDVGPWVFGLVTGDSKRVRCRGYLGHLTRGDRVLMREFTYTRITRERNPGASVRHLLKRWARARKAAKVEADGLQHESITDTEANELMLRAARAGVVPWSRVGVWDAAYRVPKRHGTTWGLLRAFSVAAAHSPPIQQPAMLYDLYKMVMERHENNKS